MGETISSFETFLAVENSAQIISPIAYNRQLCCKSVNRKLHGKYLMMKDIQSIACLLISRHTMRCLLVLFRSIIVILYNDEVMKLFLVSYIQYIVLKFE